MLITAIIVTKDALCDLKKLLVRLDEPVQRSVTKIDYLKDTIDEDKRDKILAWISTTPFGDHHSEIKGIREEGADGTCQWLIRRSEFVAWRDSSFSSMFWLTGTGKFVNSLGYVYALPRRLISEMVSGSGKVNSRFPCH